MLSAQVVRWLLRVPCDALRRGRRSAVAATLVLLAVSITAVGAQDAQPADGPPPVVEAPGADAPGADTATTDAPGADTAGARVGEASAVGSQEIDPDIGRQLMEAAVRIERGELWDAKEVYDYVLSQRADVAGIWYNRAIVHSELNMVTEAIADYDQALELSPSFAAARFNRCQLLVAIGDYDAAIPDLSALLHDFPHDARVFVLLGVASYHQGRIPDSSGYFRRAAELDPGNPLPLFNLGNIAYDERRLDAAEELFRAADNLRPDDPDVLANLANTLFALGKIEESITLYSRALEIAPDMADVIVGRDQALSARREQQSQ